MGNLLNIMSMGFCNDSTYKLFSFIGKIFNIIKIVIPIVIIILVVVDLLKTTTNPNNKNNIKLSIKRLIYGICICFVVPIITFIFSLINNNLNNKCFKIFLNPNDVTLTSADINNISSKKQCEKLGKLYIWDENECRIDISGEEVSE